MAESSVSWDGRYFRVEVLPGTDTDAVAASVATLLEGESCCSPGSQTTASSVISDKWYDSEGTRALSRHEAAVVASKFTSVVTAEVTLEPASADRLHSVLLDELEQAFERAHTAGGGVAQLWEQLPQAHASLEKRLDFLSSEQQDRVLAVIDSQLNE